MIYTGLIIFSGLLLLMYAVSIHNVYLGIYSVVSLFLSPVLYIPFWALTHYFELMEERNSYLWRINEAIRNHK